MEQFLKTVDGLVYNFVFHSKTKVHFCITRRGDGIQFCFDWDIPNKLALRFLDSSGDPTSDKYDIAPAAIEHMERIFNLKAFF